MKEFDFPWPNEKKGYELFKPELEHNPLVLFHATPKKNLPNICKEGFKSFPPLESVSYSKSSVDSLTWLFTNKSKLNEEAVVIAVLFETLDKQGIKNNHSDIHVYLKQIQPEIIGFCTVPIDYEHT